jgi:nitroreductase
MEPTLSADPSLTYHQRLAAEIMRDLDAVAAKIPYLESPHPSKAAFVRSHGNVPIPFLQTATVAVEQTEELQAVRKLDPPQAHDTLQYVEAFRPVSHHLFALGRRVKFSVTLRRSQLAFQSLQIYAIAQGLASGKRGPKIAAHVENLRRDLGRRGRPRKTAANP